MVPYFYYWFLFPWFALLPPSRDRITRCYYYAADFCWLIMPAEQPRVSPPYVRLLLCITLCLEQVTVPPYSAPLLFPTHLAQGRNIGSPQLTLPYLLLHTDNQQFCRPLPLPPATFVAHLGLLTLPVVLRLCTYMVLPLTPPDSDFVRWICFAWNFDGWWLF